MTQCELIMRHLNDCGSITSLEAMQEYGIKSMGVPIEKEMVSGKNRYGEPTSYARYSLRGS